MTVTAPPRGPDTEQDLDEHGHVSDPEALIEEARRRARLRRIRIAAALAIVGVVGLIISFPSRGSGGGATPLADGPGKATALFLPKVTVTGRVDSDTRRVVRLHRDHAPLQAVKVTLGDRTVETNADGQFRLSGVRVGTHRLLLKPMAAWWPRRVSISVGKKDTKVGPFQLAPVATLRYSFHQVRRHGDTVTYRAYFWLDGSRKGLKRVKSVNYELPHWVGSHWVANLPIDNLEAPPFCYAIFGHVAANVLSRHVDSDTVTANVGYRNSGTGFGFSDVPNAVGRAHPANCAVPTSMPPTDVVRPPTDW